MSDPSAPPPLEFPDMPPAAEAVGEDAGAGREPADRVDLSGLSIAGITRRRVGWVAAALVSAWIIVIFARQVGEATAAADRAARLTVDNASLTREVSALEDELALIVRPEYVSQQARAYQLGSPKDVAFALDSSVPPPGDGAPGSASQRLGAHDDRQTPLESWLSLLFGPG